MRAIPFNDHCNEKTWGADFRNFELEVELITKPECNSGIYLHTAYQETGFSGIAISNGRVFVTTVDSNLYSFGLPDDNR